MALEEAVTSITVEAGADLSSDQYKFVLVAADGQVDVVAAAGGDADGVLYNKPSAAGRDSTVAIMGVVKVLAGGTVTQGDKVQSGADGRALTAATGDHVLGKALTTGASGEVISVLLINHHILA